MEDIEGSDKVFKINDSLPFNVKQIKYLQVKSQNLTNQKERKKFPQLQIYTADRKGDKNCTNAYITFNK